MTNEIRLQKFLADAGICSRRKAEELITSGRVSVNGAVITQLGTKVDPARDKVAVNGKPISSRQAEPVTIVLNKPRGYITSTASRQGRTVYELVPEYKPRLLPIGRLDKDSEGVLLLTNRNDLISALTHPRYEHEKHYRATVSGKWSPSLLAALNKPMTIEDLHMKAKVQYLRPSDKPNRHVLSFVLTEGKNRQIRRMCEAVSLTVHRLIRTQFAGISIQGIEPGKWRKLTKDETASFLPR